MYYLRARYYDPALGRFLTRDAFAGVATGPESLNRYSYVFNNPALLIDPYGYWGLPSWGDIKDTAGDLGGAVVDTASDVAGEVADYLSDPQNLASTVQLVSGAVATVSCTAGLGTGVVGGTVCVVSMTVYGGATGARAALADDPISKGSIIATGIVGACTPTLPVFQSVKWTGTVANAVSAVADRIFGDTRPVTAGGRSPGRTCAALPAISGEK
jgi:hypothetical protein